MTRQERVMLLIDADNVSVDVMEQAVRLLLNQHGGVHVRRAYCTAESALKHQAAFKRLAIKPMVNLAAGKNSTDIALAVDAIDLVMAERPDVVVIASSDSDFAPLVQRLREKGCVVRGIGQLGKTGDETQDVYDDFTVLEHRKSAGAARQPAPAPAPARKRGARARLAAVSAEPPAAAPAPAPVPDREREPEAAPAPAVAPAAAPARKAARKATAKAKAEPVATPSSRTVTEPASGEAPAKPARKRAAKTATPADAPSAPKSSAPKPAAAKPAARKTAARKTAKPPAAPAAAPAEPPPPPADARLQALLACLPELGKGQPLALNVAVQRLRAAQLLGKNSSSLKFFAQWGDRVELLPPDKPAQVRLRG